MPYRSRATAKLLPGRISHAGASYFLTWCTHHRAKILTTPSTLSAVRTAITTIDESGDGQLLAATVMPDHVHVLLNLGPRLSVSQLVAKTKAAVTRQLHDLHWQLNFFEHRLRSCGNTESFALYIFMNPYNAGLSSLDEIWPGWISPGHIRWAFEDKLRTGGLPQAEWLPEAERFAQTLPAGAD